MNTIDEYQLQHKAADIDRILDAVEENKSYKTLDNGNVVVNNIDSNFAGGVYSSAEGSESYANVKYYLGKFLSTEDREDNTITLYDSESQPANLSNWSTGDLIYIVDNNYVINGSNLKVKWINGDRLCLSVGTSNVDTRYKDLKVNVEYKIWNHNKPTDGSILVNKLLNKDIVGAHAEGYKTAALNEASHSEGYSNLASGDKSHAEGQGTIASGNRSHAEGLSTVASGMAAHAEGEFTQAFGSKSHAEGTSTKTSGINAHAEGDGSEAAGICSHAEGFATQAVGESSHAQNRGTIASGDYSHAEGYNSKASGTYSHAEGYCSKASGAYSHAQGHYTVAASACQFVTGSANIIDNEKKYAFIIGNGHYQTNASNAHTVDWSGNAWYAGSVEAKAVILTSPNGKRFKVTVSDSGSLTASALS